ncbi:MAG: SAM-dependent methyltransferase [Betaproteobacteria bacterium]|jgi:16S rRNA (cytidine1402-2'-O)-methyltransferase
MPRLGTLFLIPNTLGDLDRPSQLPWVIPTEVLRQSSQIKYWIVENAKTARAFLKAVDSYHPLVIPLQELHMSEWRGSKSSVNPSDLLRPLLDGHDIGLISEAGLPAVADPGSEIVLAAHMMQAHVAPLTGPNSLMLALMGSGMNGQCFKFQGYLPIKAPDRMKALKELENESRKNNQTQLWIETPYRNPGMLSDCLEYFQTNTQLCCACDLSLPSQIIMSLQVNHWRKTLSASPQFKEGPLANFASRPAVFLILANTTTKK